MIISRRGFLTGLIAAPIVVRAGVLMPVKPLDRIIGFDEYEIQVEDILRKYDPGTMIVEGHDVYGYPITEVIHPGKVGQKAFKYIEAIEYVGGELIKQDFHADWGFAIATNMRRTT